MAEPTYVENPETRKKVYNAYRKYFDLAERKRRWSVADDIPWNQCNKNLDPVIADVVQTFCMVELYLPDYLAKQLPQVRANRGRAWMLANWGYEESKHSMALGDWLLKSGHRTEEHMQDMEDGVFGREWNLRYDNSRATVIYTMLQELATQLNYRNLRKLVGGQDPALDKVLSLVSIDEAAHAQFFRNLVEIYLEEDREATLEQFRRVISTFAMPADEILADGRRRIAKVKELKIFDEEVFFKEVYEPIMHRLGLTKADIRGKKKFKAA